MRSLLHSAAIFIMNDDPVIKLSRAGCNCDLNNILAKLCFPEGESSSFDGHRVC
jgi:hypothetical protein